MKHFFIGILVAILLAKWNPSIGQTGGILRPEITVKYVAVSIIFFNSGLTLPTEDLKGAVLQWDLHLFVQGFTFIAFPAIVYFLVSILHFTFLHPALLQGMTVLSTMPPPVSSAIILTKAVGGNEAAAVFNSALGSMLGIAVTPFLILLLLGSSEAEMPYDKIFRQLFLTVVLPLMVGQIIRNTWYKFYRRQHIPFKAVGQFLILFIIYTTFCATFSRTDLQLDSLSLVLTIMISIPMMDIIFSENPNLSFLSIPLLIYNPMQIVVGGMSIEPFRQWLLLQKQRRRNSVSYWSHV